MKLQDAVVQLKQFSEDAIICVRRPWSASAEATVTAPDQNLGVPVEVRTAGFDYFLEVSVANEVLQVFGEKPRSSEEETRLLIHYAENDAYPEWVYDR